MSRFESLFFGGFAVVIIVFRDSWPKLQKNIKIGGVVPFCAHSISYHLVPFIFMAPYGLGVGLTVRIGTLLASPSVSQSHHEDSARRAQIISATTLGLAALIGLVEAVVLYVWQGAVIALFTIDPYVVHKAESIWFFVCLYIFILHVFAIQDAILRGTTNEGENTLKTSAPPPPPPPPPPPESVVSASRTCPTRRKCRHPLSFFLFLSCCITVYTPMRS